MTGSAGSGSGRDKLLLRRAFDAAAATYDHHARLQREVADRLLERLDYIRLAPAAVADLGCGTGYCTRALSRRYPRARVTALDLSPAMVTMARRQGPRWRRRPLYVVGDVERPPFRPGSLDLAFSSLTLQWANDLQGCFARLRSCLVPGGLFLFSTFGPDTLLELREAWRRVDRRVHVNPFVDLHDVGDLLAAQGFRDVVMDVDRIPTHHPDPLELMRGLKAIGAHNINPGRNPGLTGRDHLRALLQHYPRDPDGSVTATYEVVYGHAWAPAAPAPVTVPLPHRRDP